MSSNAVVVSEVQQASQHDEGQPFRTEGVPEVVHSIAAAANEPMAIAWPDAANEPSGSEEGGMSDRELMGLADDLADLAAAAFLAGTLAVPPATK